MWAAIKQRSKVSYSVSDASSTSRNSRVVDVWMMLANIFKFFSSWFYLIFCINLLQNLKKCLLINKQVEVRLSFMFNLIHIITPMKMNHHWNIIDILRVSFIFNTLKSWSRRIPLRELLFGLRTISFLKLNSRHLIFFKR